MKVRPVRPNKKAFGKKVENRKYWERLSKLYRTFDCAPRETIVSEGSRGDMMYIVVRGIVDVVLYTEDGREIVVASIEEGNFFGEMSLLNDQPRSATIVARTHCRITVMRRTEYLDMVSREPELALLMLVELSQRLRNSNDTIRLLSFSKARDRVEWYLERLWAKARMNDEPVDLPSNTRIATEVGLCRETVSRAINELKREGWFDKFLW